MTVERLPDRSASSAVPTLNPPTSTPAVPNPEGRPKKRQRVRPDPEHDRSVPPPADIVPSGDIAPFGRGIGCAEEDDDSATDHGLPTHRSSSSAPAPAPIPGNPVDPREPDHESLVPNPVINMGNRPWPEADDNELIGYKLDARSRPSWKTIGQRMRSSADSRKARWQWLKNTRPDLLTRADNEAED